MQCSHFPACYNSPHDFCYKIPHQQDYNIIANYKPVEKRRLRKLYLLYRLIRKIMHRTARNGMHSIEQNISQIKQKMEHLLFGVKFSFSCLNPQNCPFVLQFCVEIIVYQVAELCYEYNGQTLKLYI